VSTDKRKGPKDDPCDDWSDHPIPKTSTDKLKHPAKCSTGRQEQSDIQCT